MALQVSGKTALVTGGGSGICLAFTKLLLENRCNVVIADLQLNSEAEEVLESRKGMVVFQKTDVTEWRQLKSAFDTAISEFGSLDIVCPGAGIFEPNWSSFWEFDQGVDNESTSSYKSIDINITHPIRATQLAIDSFRRQKLGAGVVVLVSSIAAQLALLPAPMYSASKHAISGFVRSLAPLEPTLNIRVNAVAPGIVNTPLWTEDKLTWRDENLDTWVTLEDVAKVMLDLVQMEENIGGTILEVGAENVRRVEELNDPGPIGKGVKASNAASAAAKVFGVIESNFGQS